MFMIKRFIGLALAIVLAVILPYAAMAEWETGFLLPEGMKEAMTAAGRKTEEILDGTVISDDNLTAAAVLVRSGNTVQLTVLEQNEDGVWHIAACNDTIPVSAFTEATVSRGFQGLNGQEKKAFTFWMEMQKYLHVNAVLREFLAYRRLEIIRSPIGDWVIRSVHDVSFEEPQDGRCPYLILNRTDGGWNFVLYEFVKDMFGEYQRSDVILIKDVSSADMSNYMPLAQMHYPSLLIRLYSLIPEEHEHFVPPSPAPTQAPDKAGTVYYNPQGGRYYHADQKCPSVSEKYLPLTPIPATDLGSPAFSALLPCPHCCVPDASGSQ